MIAAIPANEDERLTNLREYQILDSGQDRAFDNLVKIAAAVAETPISLISLVDSDRQWFKAKVGFDLSGSSRDLSFCSHSILSREPTIVSDTTFDIRFSDHPFVTARPNLRFYAGFPLISQEGFALGTLCVLDFVPRILTTQQVNILKMLAGQAVALIERNRAEKTIEFQKGVLSASTKLMALGQMTAEIVHEIRNPLSVIQARASLLAAKAHAQSPAMDFITDSAEKIVETSKRMNKIIQGLSGMIRPSETEDLEIVSARVLIDESISLCHDRCREAGILVNFEACSEDFTLNCHPVQISQVLINLINNSVDAISALPEKWIKIEIVKKSDTVEIQLSDSGKGIKGQHLKKLFDPFYTTKSPGKGMGLGLSISKGIMDAHQGSLRCNPDAQHTQFILSFPA